MINELDELIPNLMKEYKVPGIAIALIEKSKISIRTFGYSNKERKVPITENTIFQIASISKSISTWGVMKLLEKGLINLDDPVEKFLTRWHLPHSDFNHNEVTIKRLLSHTAGLSLHSYLGFLPSIELPSIEDSLSGQINYQRDDIQKKHKEKFLSEGYYDYDSVMVIIRPGLKYMHSGGGYTLLQLVIEEITNQSFAEYMEKEILQPLGMNNSSFLWRQDLQPSTATAYYYDQSPVPNYLFTALAAAGCYSSIVDLAIFTLAGMTGSSGELPGRGILRPQTVQMIYKKVTDAEKIMNFDMDIGLGHYLINCKGIKIVNHSGGNIGWTSMILFIPMTSDGLVILTNSNNGFFLIKNLILRWLEYILSKS
ncbi:MAG: serine hydrolase domain-containing protein [Promethearchaeota archaeon]